MLRKRQQRGVMWAAAAAMGFAAVVSWWSILDGGFRGPDLTVSIGLTAAALIWLANALAARTAAMATSDRTTERNTQ